MIQIPSVTIGIPVYNEEKFVAETVMSALNQTYKNIKIIISDNCSTDQTFEILQELVSGLEHVTLISQEKNISASPNFSFVRNKANTEYFCWLGGHDLMQPTFIEKAINIFLNNEDVSLVYPMAEMIDEMGLPMNIAADSDIDTTQLNNIDGPLKVVKNLHFCTAIHGLFKSDILKSYTIKTIIGADQPILFHAAVHGKLYPLTEILYLRRQVRKENKNEVIKRYSDYGLKAKSDKNPFKELCKEYLLYLWKEKNIGLKRRLILIRDVSSVIRKKYNSPYIHSLTDFLHFLRRMKKIIL